MVELSSDIWFVAARRTAFGAFGGAVKDLRATDLGALAATAAVAQSGFSPEEFDQVVFGNVIQTSTDDIYCARHVGLRAGLPVAVPALTVNRLCGSGFQAIVTAAQEMRTGDAEVCLVGGTESLSQAPHLIRGARWGFPLGKAPPVEDLLWTSLTDGYAGCSMAVTAENLADKYGISRQDCDSYALESQRRWAAAAEAGRFHNEIIPVEINSRRGPVKFERDEHARPETTIEGLAKLPPAFKQDGVVTAGNASGICDGAAALVMATRAVAKRRNIAPLGGLVSWGFVGVDPKHMGIGPVPAIHKALGRAGLSLGDMDLVEVNEAFAAQYLAVEAEAKLPRDRTNVDGGAIALGHPLAASGARIVAHLLYELRRRKGRFGLGAACIGGGQGIAVVVEAAP